MVYEVPFKELYNWLTAQPENTVDAPYKLKITDLSEEDLYTPEGERTSNLGRVLGNTTSKYVDLSYTLMLPNVQYNKTFYLCANIIKPPIFPEGIGSDFTEVFKYCINLKETPILPESVQTINDAFHFCVGLSKVNPLPNSIIKMDRAFRGCTELTGSVIVPSQVKSMDAAFEGCENLDKLYLNVDPYTYPSDNNALLGLKDTEIVIPYKYQNYYKENVSNWGYLGPVSNIKINNETYSLISELEGAFYITASPSEEMISWSEDGKTVNIWNYPLEGTFTLSHKFPDTLISADLSGIDFTNVTSFSYMFFYCEKLRKLILPKINFKDRSVKRMFAGCSALTQLDLSSMDTTELTDSSEMFSLDNIVIYYNPLKWEMGFGSRFGNANNARFVPIEEIENKIFIDGKQVGTFYHDGLKYKKAIKQNRTYFLDDYGCLLGLSDDTPIPDSAWGENENGEFQAWVFSE